MTSTNINTPTSSRIPIAIIHPKDHKELKERHGLEVHATFGKPAACYAKASQAKKPEPSRPSVKKFFFTPAALKIAKFAKPEHPFASIRIHSRFKTPQHNPSKQKLSAFLSTDYADFADFCSSTA